MLYIYKVFLHEMQSLSNFVEVQLSRVTVSIEIVSVATFMNSQCCLSFKRQTHFHYLSLFLLDEV